MFGVAPLNGVVSFQADGRRWRLHFGLNALCELEANAKDEEQLKLLLSGGDADFNTVRLAVWAGLIENQPELTLQDAGRLVDRIGLQQAGAKVGQALMCAFPPAGADVSARPRRAAWWKVWGWISKAF